MPLLAGLLPGERGYVNLFHFEDIPEENNPLT
jgi:hypothetical protein